MTFVLYVHRSRHVFYLATVLQKFHHDAAATSAAVPNQPYLATGGKKSGIGSVVPPQETVSYHQEPLYHPRAPSNASSATTARTSLSSADTVDDISSDGCLTEPPVSLGDPQNLQAEENGTGRTHDAPLLEEAVGNTAVWSAFPGQQKSSDSLSREKFLTDILWRGGGDETNEVFSVENFENEQHSHQPQLKSVAETNTTDKVIVADGAVKVSPPRVFHQRSKSNVESSSSRGGPVPELTREFGSDESLLSSPKKVSGLLLVFFRIKVVYHSKHQNIYYSELLVCQKYVLNCIVTILNTFIFLRLLFKLPLNKITDI